MRKRIALLTFFFFLVTATAVLAGGWAVLTLDQWPRAVVAGQPVTVGYTLRQHGVHAVSGGAGKVTAVSRETGARVRAEAVETGAAGHYEATLIFPEAGEWLWRIEAFGDHPMPPLSVAAAPAPPIAAAAAAPPPGLPVATGAAGLAALAGALLTWRQKRPRWAVGLALAGAIIGSAAFWWPAPTSVTAVSQATTAVSRVETALSTQPLDAAYGAALFVAKGCTTCHQHQGRAEYTSNSVNIGPDLTHYKADPAFVRTWLRDPASVRPETQMPALGLSADEITALLAFLSQPAAKEASSK